MPVALPALRRIVGRSVGAQGRVTAGATGPPSSVPGVSRGTITCRSHREARNRESLDRDTCARARIGKEAPAAFRRSLEDDPNARLLAQQLLHCCGLDLVELHSVVPAFTL